MLTLYNVTHEDEGWYTCVAANTLGSSLEKAYLRVVDELPEDDIPTAHPVRHHSTLITVMTMVLSGCFMVLAIIVVIVCKKLKREKMKHRAMEHVNQWTKKVIVLKQPPVENSIPGVTDAMVSGTVINGVIGVSNWSLFNSKCRSCELRSSDRRWFRVATATRR